MSTPVKFTLDGQRGIIEIPDGLFDRDIKAARKAWSDANNAFFRSIPKISRLVKIPTNAQVGDELTERYRVPINIVGIVEKVSLTTQGNNANVTFWHKADTADIPTDVTDAIPQDFWDSHGIWSGRIHGNQGLITEDFRPGGHVMEPNERIFSNHPSTLRWGGTIVVTEYPLAVFNKAMRL